MHQTFLSVWRSHRDAVWKDGIKNIWQIEQNTVLLDRESSEQRVQQSCERFLSPQILQYSNSYWITTYTNKEQFGFC